MQRTRGVAWTRKEVESTVDAYFQMLAFELAGQPYNKASRNRELQHLLSNRTRAAIELKHQNISAILNELHCGYIPGYKPMSNYQLLLSGVVEDRLLRDPNLDALMLNAVQRPAVQPDVPLLEGVLVAPPRSTRVRDSSRVNSAPRRPIRRDYFDMESRNRSLGLAGEKFVADFESRRLHAAGRKKLADHVEHVAVSKGDGLGYDVLSFELSGRERFIEVKTTTFGAATPFYVSRNELAFSEEESDRFVIARVHEFRSSPKMFELRGAIRTNVTLDPVSYVARV